MAIDNTNVVDAIAIDNKNRCLILLLFDYFKWDNSQNEYKHLILLQEKINAYIVYLESKQYEEFYKKSDITFTIIKIHFKYEISINCEKFLQTVQNYLGQYKIKIEAHIS